MISDYLFLTFGTILFSYGVTNGAAKTCGYDACNPGKPGMLNVHIISHTHDDVGWTSTLDQYYGTDSLNVRNILNSVFGCLLEDANRRFVYVESAFFYKWWMEQSVENQTKVTELVNSGRLEFLGGGWVMNDEATTEYESIIEQMTLGNRFLNDTFGECGVPKTIWQIDPFGHSRQQASLMAQMNFDGMFLGRIDYQDIGVRRTNKNMEFIWKGSDSLGKDSDIFTGVLPNIYWEPRGFCFDIYCADEEIRDDNAERRSKEFIALVQKQAETYRTRHTIITMGMDFHYSYAPKPFRNLDKLMAHINSMQINGSRVNAFYSTPTCYLKSLHSEGETWKSETTDFFPYASEVHSYWTGYFTSRPTLKYYSRKAAAFLQMCKQITTQANMPNAKINPLKQAVSVLQHHDGISGTERQHVADDYASMLSVGISGCQEEVKNGLKTLFPAYIDSKDQLQFCEKLNNTECSVSENEAMFGVLLYNTLSRNITYYCRLPVEGQGYVVYDGNGDSINYQIVPVPSFLSMLPDRTSKAGYELVFPVNTSALSASTFTIKRLEDNAPIADKGSSVETPNPGSTVDYSIGNEFLRINVSALTGLLESITIGQETTTVRQNYFYYLGEKPYKGEKASGAYSFNPLYDQCSPVSNKAKVTVVKGYLVEEIFQEFSEWVSQVIRVYKGKPYVELDWIVGPIPSMEGTGMEIITKFETNFETKKTFYTDSNSRETMERIRDYRPTWNLTVNEAVSGNYYPVTNFIFIKDQSKDLQLTLLTDRAQGGSSINDGQLELMVHRRTLYDDVYGVDEPLNERGSNGKGLVVRGKHLLILNGTEGSSRLIRELTKEIYHAPFPIFWPLPEAKITTGGLSASALNSTLPPNIHLLTLELLREDEVLIRLEHVYEENEHKTYSTPVKISLKNLFRSFEITNIQETTLSANQYLKDVKRLQWKYADGQSETKNVPDEKEKSGNFEITLGPMQIRTFIVTIKRSS